MNRSTIIYTLVGAILLVSSRQQRKQISHNTQKGVEQVYAPKNPSPTIPLSREGVEYTGSLQTTGTIAQVCYKDTCFAVEIADSPEERQIGLMNRTLLGENSGMLFAFPRAGSYGFWMKNTLIPLDMIWLDATGTVVEIATATPCGVTGSLANNCAHYGGAKLANYVLELNARVAENIGLKVGENMNFRK